MVTKIKKIVGNYCIESPEKIIIFCRKRMPLSNEVIQNAANLSNVLSREDLVRTIPQIDNVSAVLSRDPMVDADTPQYSPPDQ